jgi:hypothetical protein
MTKLIRVFGTEFVNGIKESPRMYFAPVSAIIKAAYHEAMGEEEYCDGHRSKKKTEKKNKRTAA